jgi:hypothetical protein
MVLIRGPDRTGQERRRSERRQARAGLRLIVRRVAAKIGENLGARLNDVSVDGAGVRLMAPVSVGERIELTVLRATDRETARVKATARWCKPIGGGLFAAGVAFERPLTETEYAHLVSSNAMNSVE